MSPPRGERTSDTVAERGRPRNGGLGASTLPGRQGLQERTGMPPGGSTGGRAGGRGQTHTHPVTSRPRVAPRGRPTRAPVELVGPAGQVVAPETKPFWAWQRDRQPDPPGEQAGQSVQASPLPSRAPGKQTGWGLQVCPGPWDPSGAPLAELQPQGDTECHPDDATTWGKPHIKCQELMARAAPKAPALHRPQAQTPPGAPGSKLTPPPPARTCHRPAVHKCPSPRTWVPSTDSSDGAHPTPVVREPRSPCSRGPPLNARAGLRGPNLPQGS